MKIAVGKKSSADKRAFSDLAGHVDGLMAMVGVLLVLGIYGSCATLHYWRVKRVAEAEEVVRIAKAEQAAKAEMFARAVEERAEVVRIAKAEQAAKAEMFARAVEERAEEVRVLREREILEQRFEIVRAETKKAEAVGDAYRAYSEYLVSRASAKEREWQLALKKQPKEAAEAKELQDLISDLTPVEEPVIPSIKPVRTEPEFVVSPFRTIKESAVPSPNKKVYTEDNWRFPVTPQTRSYCKYRTSSVVRRIIVR